MSEDSDSYSQPAAATAPTSINVDPSNYTNYNSFIADIQAQNEAAQKAAGVNTSTSQFVPNADEGGHGEYRHVDPSYAPTTLNFGGKDPGSFMGSAPKVYEGNYDGLSAPSYGDISGHLSKENGDGTYSQYYRGGDGSLQYSRQKDQKPGSFGDSFFGTLSDAAPYALALGGLAAGVGAFGGLGSLGEASTLAPGLGADVSGFQALDQVLPEALSSSGAGTGAAVGESAAGSSGLGADVSNFQTLNQVTPDALSSSGSTPPGFDDTGIPGDGLPQTPQNPGFDDTGIPGNGVPANQPGILDKISQALKAPGNSGKSLMDIVRGLNLTDLAKGAGLVGSLLNKNGSGSINRHLTMQDQLNQLRGSGSGGGLSSHFGTPTNFGQGGHQFIPSQGDPATRPYTNQGEHQWFTPTSFADGGAVGTDHDPHQQAALSMASEYGKVSGPGDGQSDSIPAHLADGEYVFDADTVSALGNGSSEAGSRLLDHFREQLRAHKRSADNGSIPPPTKAVHEYFKGAK